MGVDGLEMTNSARYSAALVHRRNKKSKQPSGGGAEVEEAINGAKNAEERDEGEEVMKLEQLLIKSRFAPYRRL